ncbi:hypothetical protein HHL16_08265 [Pseudoflavitalea sp. G-6-1-2]|uniref:YciI family protein n=1 Tax=Pseudoflavitalea sp. G-6-1-2 TaxID=2728841 RepID=UPI00146DEF18|nr:YciI family protein [Pseudoflavitalea sp. G-6-1-2]NML20865.1 hypothetical protein [Pseudoflavitalea sp. G-6-1-2]
MKQLIFSAILLCSAIISVAQTNNIVYNKALADSLGADKYGMKSYIFVVLKTGTYAPAEKDKLNELFRGHMENINRLANAGKLIVAGPFRKNDKSYRGIFILNVKTTAEAKELLDKDPAIKQKLFDVELLEWYGSAALPLYLPYHEKIEAEKH